MNDWSHGNGWGSHQGQFSLEPASIDGGGGEGGGGGVEGKKELAVKKRETAISIYIHDQVTGVGVQLEL